MYFPDWNDPGFWRIPNNYNYVITTTSTSTNTSNAGWWTYENDRYEQKVEVAGCSKEQVEVTYNEKEDRLEVRASAGSRKYSFDLDLPDDLDEDTVTAKVENGLLTLQAKKVASQSRKIVVE